MEPRRDLYGALDQSGPGRRGRPRRRHIGRPLLAPRAPRPDRGLGRRGFCPRVHGRRAVAALPVRRRAGRHGYVELLPAQRDDGRAMVRRAPGARACARSRRVQSRVHHGRTPGSVAHHPHRLARGLRSPRGGCGALDPCSPRSSSVCRARRRQRRSACRRPGRRARRMRPAPSTPTRGAPRSPTRWPTLASGA